MATGMRYLMNNVSDFHRATDTPVLSSPTLPPEDRIELRVRLITEEVRDELLQHLIDLKIHRQEMDLGRKLCRSTNPKLIELIRKDMALMLDACADAIYVIVGTAVEFGLPLDAVWMIVQAANMSKVDSVTGKVIRREDGKVLKPEGWESPDEAILALIPQVTLGAIIPNDI